MVDLDEKDALMPTWLVKSFQVRHYGACFTMNRTMSIFADGLLRLASSNAVEDDLLCSILDGR